MQWLFGIVYETFKIILNRSLFRTDYIYWCTTWWRCPRKPSIAPLILVYMYCTWPWIFADCFFLVTRVNHVAPAFCRCLPANFAARIPCTDPNKACRVIEDSLWSENDFPTLSKNAYPIWRPCRCLNGLYFQHFVLVMLAWLRKPVSQRIRRTSIPAWITWGWSLNVI